MISSNQARTASASAQHHGVAVAVDQHVFAVVVEVH